MSKYIKLNAAIRILWELCMPQCDYESGAKQLESLPTIDIVRCGECENVGTEDCPVDEVYRDDFCCWGISRKDRQ